MTVKAWELDLKEIIGRYDKEIMETSLFWIFMKIG